MNGLLKWISWAIWAVAVSGCALQSTVMDMENDTETLKKHQQELQGRLERLEKGTRGAGAPQPEGQKVQADLVLRMDRLESDLQTLSGRVDEENHLLTTLAKRVEDQSFRIGELLNRLDAVEARLLAPDKEGVKNGELSDGKPVLPGDSSDPKKRTSLTPTQAYNLAYNDYLKGNYDLAIAGFQGFISQYPGSATIPQALYWVGESYYNKKAFSKAVEFFDRVQQDYPRSEKAPNALLKEGFSYLEMGDRAKARLYLKKVIELHPLSNEANLAKDKLSDLR